MELTDSQKKILIGVGIVLLLLLATVAYGGKPLLRRAGILAPLDCQYSEWSEWKGDWKCSMVPGTAEQTKTRTRTRTIKEQPQGAGLACDVSSLTQTEKKICPAVSKDCVEGTWGEWSQPACEKDANGKFIGGTKPVTRTRSGDIQPVFGGKACTPATETKEVTCPIDCILSDWKAGITPIDQCGEEGKRTGNVLENSWKWTKDVLQSPSTDPAGEPCGPTDETRDFTCPKDCVVSEWVPGPEPSCGQVGSRTGNRLDRTYSRTIISQPTADSNGNMGKACPNDLTKTVSNEYQCPKDCVPGPWDKTDNDLVCRPGPRDSYTETGLATRTVTPAEFGGICSTEDSQTTKPISKFCPAIPQPCVLGDRPTTGPIDYSQCPAGNYEVLNKAKMSLVQDIKTEAKFGAPACPSLQARTITQDVACPTDCKYTVSSFATSCPATVPNDINPSQVMTVTKTVKETNGGYCTAPVSVPCFINLLENKPFNFGRKINNNISDGDWGRNDSRWHLENGSTFKLNDDGSITFTNSPWFLYSNIITVNNNYRARIIFKIRNDSKDANGNIIPKYIHWGMNNYEPEGQFFSTTLTTNNFVEVNSEINLKDISRRFTSAYPFIIRLSMHGTYTVSNPKLIVANNNGFLDSNFIAPNRYDSTALNNFGGIKNFQNYQYYCPLGSPIVRNQMEYSDLVAEHEDRRDKNGNISTDDIRRFRVNRDDTWNCSGISANIPPNSTPFTKMTPFTNNLKDIMADSKGNFDCTTDNNGRSVNAVLQGYKLVESQDGNKNKNYAIEYTCQPVIPALKSDGTPDSYTNTTTDENTSLIYNDRKWKNRCKPGYGISKIDMKYNNGKDFSMTNTCLSLGSFPTTNSLNWVEYKNGFEPDGITPNNKKGWDIAGNDISLVIGPWEVDRAKAYAQSIGANAFVLINGGEYAYFKNIPTSGIIIPPSKIEANASFYILSDLINTSKPNNQVIRTSIPNGTNPERTLYVNGNSNLPGANGNLVINSSKSTNFTLDNNNLLKIGDINSTKCIQSNGQENSPLIVDCNPNEPKQKWMYLPKTGSFKNTTSNICLDLFAKNNTDGANVLGWGCNNQENQNWKF
jgi:hypothetical protein